MSKPNLILLSLICATVTAGAADFAGVAVQPGGTVQAQVPLSPQQRSYVSEGGNTPPAHALAALAVPANFDPNRTWPVLVCFATSDFKRKNRDDLRDFYSRPALAEGWVVIAGDAEGNPRQDSAGWRAGMTLAALDALHRSFPGSNKWPVAVAGFSGGAKRAGNLAPLLAVAGNRISGIFLTGINEDRMVEAYRLFKPGSGFLRTPIYISAGQGDRVARYGDQQKVAQELQRAGFSNVRVVPTPHGHAISRGALREALRWFRGQG